MEISLKNSNYLHLILWSINEPVGIVEFFFWENKNLRPANLFLMPLETRTKK